MVTGLLHSTSICPPHSPTRITKNSTLKSSGAFHWPNTSRIRFWAFSYSMGEPCGRSNQLITYFIVILLNSVGPRNICCLDGLSDALSNRFVVFCDQDYRRTTGRDLHGVGPGSLAAG